MTCNVSRRALLAMNFLWLCSAAHAEGWCDLQPGWQVIAHGNNSNNVYIQGAFVGHTTVRWIVIANPAANVGQSNVALALTAAALGRNVSVYLDSVEHDCANFKNWSGAIRHLR